nr:glycosyltransferase family 2 protein [Methanospirillum lacunae]
MPLVSIGIPTYNRPEGLRRTLECITEQTYKNLEIIVSDNCSRTQETEEIVREFMARDNRIQYFRQKENYGMAFNFKFVLEKSSGDYFMLASDDDLWDNSFIEKCLSPLINQNSCSMAFSNFNTIDSYDQVIYDNTKPAIYSNRNKYFRLAKFLFFNESWGKGTLTYSLFRKELTPFLLDFLKKNENSINVQYPAEVCMLINIIDHTDYNIVKETLFHKRWAKKIDTLGKSNPLPKYPYLFRPYLPPRFFISYINALLDSTTSKKVHIIIIIIMGIRFMIILVQWYLVCIITKLQKM